MTRAATSIRVYLVRHGAAEPQGPGGDAARRLTAAGRAELEAHLVTLGGALAPVRILTSPLARARDTAALLAAATGAPVLPEAALASGASNGRALLALAVRAGAGTALVGHNPEIGEAVALAAGRELPVPPGAVAALDVEDLGGRRAGARELRARLAWLRAPGG